MAMIRKPAVAGQFYPSNPKSLKHEVRSYLEDVKKRIDALGVVSPHAGYIYSGKVAGEVFSRIRVPRRVIVLGPNHRRMGNDAAIMGKGQWEMPMGNIPIDRELAARIRDESSLVVDDADAHRFEHSLEVQLPFLHAINPDFLLTPIVLGELSLPECLTLGDELGKVIGDFGKKGGESILVVASSDMSHYVSDDVARERDGKAIDQILSLSPEGLYRTVYDMKISMCGVIPVTVMLRAALACGAKKAELIDYRTSGEVSGDYDRVVGYVGIAISS